MLRWLLPIVFIGHGFAHLVGFVVPWGLWEVKDAPYKTTTHLVSKWRARPALLKNP